MNTDFIKLVHKIKIPHSEAALFGVLIFCLFWFQAPAGLCADPEPENAPVHALASPPVPAGDEPVIIQEIKVRIISASPEHTDDPPNDHTRNLLRIAHGLIRQKPGDTITPDGLAKTLAALKISRRFSDIHVETEPSSEGDVLVFILTPYHHIADIRIHGAAPLFHRDVFNVMTLYPGDVYSPDDLPAQVAPIVARYKREGYISPAVSVTRSGETDTDGKDILVVNIEKGPARHLRNLEFNGNSRIGSATLKRKMKTWWVSLLPGGRFAQPDLREDIQTLLAYYREKGFFDARITARTEMADDGQKVDLILDIEEGTQFCIGFSGNEKFWNMTLKKDVALFKDGNRSNIGVRKTIKAIKQRYHEKGFLEAQVRFEIHPVPEADPDTQEIRFVITEGPQSTVEAVTITGNQTISEEEIKKSILTRPPGWFFHDGAYVPEVLEEDVFAVTGLYQQRGFQDREVNSRVSVASPDSARVAVDLAVIEGPKTTVRSIEVEGRVDGMSDAAIKKALIHHIGDPFQDAALQAEKLALTSLVAEYGYPHAAVEPVVTFSADRTQAEIVHRITPGPAVILGDIFISGNLRTQDSVIRRELGVLPGDPLALQKLYEGQRRLRDLDIFQEVKYRSPGLQEKSDTVHLFVDVREKTPYFTQFGVGYESDTGTYGRAEVGDRNIFGWNKALSLGGKVSETGYRLESQLVEPRFLGTLTQATLSVYMEEETPFNQTFGTRTTGGSLVFSRDLARNLTGSLGFSLEQRKQFTADDFPLNEVDESARTVFVTRPTLRYDTRDSFVRPTSGVYSSLGVDISHGLTNTLDDFVRYEMDTRFYRTPVDRLTVAAMARIGQVLPYGGGDNVPDDQLFFLGGIQDIRGYAENTLRLDRFGDPVGGKLSMAGSLELRFDLGMNLELATFYDIGSVRDAIVDEGSDDFKSTVGLGLRYITAIGPIGIVYGHKLDREDDESAGRWHFSIGYSF
ncbi:outer membrane protein assembly factor BamA [Desulfosarcina sp. OttesenSCG-928-G10]|nr:outer membrane protein assembly factor BamA [Desulfosarcina sp. OttesenSCG-928-G10]